MRGDHFVGHIPAGRGGLYSKDDGNIRRAGRFKMALQHISPCLWVDAATLQIAVQYGAKVQFGPEHMGMNINNHSEQRAKF